MSWNLVPPDAVREVESIIQRSRWPLYIFGQQGRGKSCLAAQVHQVWPSRAVWFDVSDLLSQVPILPRHRIDQIRLHQKLHPDAHLNLAICIRHFSALHLACWK